MKSIITIFLLMFSLVGMSQQDAQYSQNLFINSSINPGYAGTSGDINLAVINRNQWMGFEGKPTTNLIAIDAGFNLFGYQSGASLSIVDDKLGVDKNFGLNLGYSYKMQFGNGVLGIGFNLGLLNKSVDATSFKASVQSDDHIPITSSIKVFNSGLGLFFNSEKYYIGLSCDHINQPAFDLLAIDKNNKNTKTSILQKRHYYLTSGYNIQTIIPLLEVRPSIIVQSDATSYQLNIGATAFFDRRFWAGITYRMSDAIVGMIGLELKNGIKIGYAYDITTSKMRKDSNGSHEVFLGYSFSFAKDKSVQKYKSVRFL